MKIPGREKLSNIGESKIFDYTKNHHILAAVIAYAFLSIVFTYPLIAKFSSEIPEGGRDSFLVMGQIESRSAHHCRSRLARGDENYNSKSRFWQLSSVYYRRSVISQQICDK